MPEAPRREYLTTFRNNPAVVVGGYTYVKKATVKRATYCRCVKCNGGCKATGKSAENSLEVVVVNDNHNHDPDHVQVKVSGNWQVTGRHLLANWTWPILTPFFQAGAGGRGPQAGC